MFYGGTANPPATERAGPDKASTYGSARQCPTRRNICERCAGPETVVVRADPPNLGEVRRRSGKETDRSTGSLLPGYWRRHACKMEYVATREALLVVSTHQPEARMGRAGRVAERPVRLKTPGNAGRGKGPQVRRDD